MARALPFYVRQLFAFLDRLGWSQRQCAAALDVSPQAINNWASGGLNVPVRHRASIVMLVDMAMRYGEQEASTHPSPSYAQWRERCEHFLSLWMLECAEQHGRLDAWYANLGRNLSRTFDKPLSEQSVEAYQMALGLHLEAARVLRLQLRLHKTTQDHGAYSAFLSFDRMFHLSLILWAQADAVAGERLERSLQSADVLRERVLTIPTLSVEQREWISTWVPEEAPRYSQEFRAKQRGMRQSAEAHNTETKEPSGETPVQT